jgi:hypothetical protein
MIGRTVRTFRARAARKSTGDAGRAAEGAGRHTEAGAAAAAPTARIGLSRPPRSESPADRRVLLPEPVPGLPEPDRPSDGHPGRLPDRANGRRPGGTPAGTGGSRPRPSLHPPPASNPQSGRFGVPSRRSSPARCAAPHAVSGRGCVREFNGGPYGPLRQAGPPPRGRCRRERRALRPGTGGRGAARRRVPDGVPEDGSGGAAAAHPPRRRSAPLRPPRERTGSFSGAHAPVTPDEIPAPPGFGGGIRRPESPRAGAPNPRLYRGGHFC